MRGRIAVLLCALWTGAPLLAQEDPMVMQRCVWACLANNGPNTNPAYHACVQRVCVEGAKPTSSVPQKGAAWGAGALDGGRTRYAGIDTPNGLRGLYYFCNRSGRSELMIAGVPPRASSYEIEVGGKRFAFRFAPTKNGVAATVPAGHAVFSALRGGSAVKISQQGGPERIGLKLAGSSGALGAAMGGCR
ncbi:hypothetical protein [Salipiger sp.]|uniref:hypothetical protein n=1 Tax=Salipiger sp. TaxID=2078585 RepID=UPI003A970FA7